MDALLIVGAVILLAAIVTGVVLALSGYTLAESRKFVTAVVFAAGSAATLFVVFDPSFTQAIASLVGAVYATIGVFAATNHTVDDVQKALEALKGAALSVVGFYITVPASTGTQLTVLIISAVAVYAVYKRGNEPVPLRA